MNAPLSRRDFVFRSSLASAAALAVPTVLAAQASAPAAAPTDGAAPAEGPDTRLRVAICGAGGRGMAAVDGLASENIVAICDVDEARCAEAVAAHPQARFFRDYRKMFESMAGEIDAVTVSTPDHTHFQIAMAAIQHGKHVFVEKPLTHSIWEARELTLAARKAGVATQMGNQGHANEGTRLMREWIQAGAIGKVHTVYHWTNRPIWPQGMRAPDHSKFIPVQPKTLDWDGWLGVAPDRPYDPAYVPFNWRGWWDFGTGALGDMGCHVMDAVYWALDLGAPEWVEAAGTEYNDQSPPKASVVTYQYGARGDMPPVKVVWYDGGLKPAYPKGVPVDTVLPESGSLLVGDGGVMMSDTYNSSVRLVPEEKMRAFAPNRPPRSIPRVEGGDHFAEWVRACKGGDKAGSNFDYAGPFTEAVLLGVVALRARHRIYWDAANARVTNDESANQYVRRPYRPGWGV
ncbi:Gfo/Idh/MocA family oxidoreductase [Opitutales bacterium ASA1]|uniref:Gfo/Idh/MocA family oxidoreductase n=1 Tax=Congregicoccus parvus TaxID=3081749 RepID=UPI002B30780C|nr:Gfo/Idh/MocA family oxidoreductase [Opitutales bacterium ASA1]